MKTKKSFFISFSLILLSLLHFTAFDASTKNLSKMNNQEINNYSDISSGYRHACALNASGELKCWGSNTYGQIGDDSYTFAAISTPGSIPGLETEIIADYEAGGFNTCIINSSGALKCWGDNNYKELGNPSYYFWASGTPVQVSGLESGVTDVAIGHSFICALKEDGDAYCWGLDYKRLFDNNELIFVETPQLVETNFSFNSIYANGSDVCAITTDGQVACWVSGSTPSLISGLENVLTVSISEIEKCALIAATESEEPKVMCWGDVPTEVTGLNGTPLELAAGKEHTCAIVQNAGVNSVMCWGRNREGQLGIGSTTDVNTPTTVPNSNGAIKLSAGEFHTNMLTDTGLIRSWGANTEGQLGNGALFRRQLPIHIQNKYPSLNVPLKNIVSGEYHTCALTEMGSVWCWGGNNFGQVGNGTTQYTPDPVQILLNGVSDIFAGSYHTCALLNTSEVMCWGLNHSGTLGTNDPNVYSISPRLVVDSSSVPLTNVADVGCGNGYSCALLLDGSIECWGFNNFGQLGVAGIEYSTCPVQVQSFPGAAISLAVGQEHTCAVTDSKEAYCWGVNYNGNLGIGESDFDSHSSPEKVINLTNNIVDINTGFSRTCVLTELGGVSCWGGSDMDHTPVPVEGLDSGVEAISTNGSLEFWSNHTCALMEGTGAVKCWGHNNYSQLGDGSYDYFGGGLTPVDVLGLSGNVVSIQTGAASTCAFFESGAAACWGFDYQIETLPVDLVEVNDQDLPPSIFFSNYYEGAPGSYFVITGLYFPPNEFVDIYINETYMGNIFTNETGVFKFFSYFNVEGTYEVRVELSQTASEIGGTTAHAISSRAESNQDQLTIVINEGGPLRIKEGDGYTVGEVMFYYFYPLFMN